MSEGQLFILANILARSRAMKAVGEAPLCPEHHRGASGLHGLGTGGFERRYRLGELDLLAMTIEALSASA